MGINVVLLGTILKKINAIFLDNKCYLPFFFKYGNFLKCIMIQL